MTPFSVARLPRIEFGQGAFSRLPELSVQYGHRLLVVTGDQSFQSTSYWDQLVRGLSQNSVEWTHVKVKGEPSPTLIDETVQNHAEGQFDLVVGIGGGSALDAAKAIAGLLRIGRSVMDYLEGVGPELPYGGPAVPFIAVPTTAGTGSEATKNAVLSILGEKGFKKSFRHEMLVAEYAVVDPDLLASCPPAVIAANGMDALTQLMESYVSTKSNPFTDALAKSGLEAARDGLLEWYEQGAEAREAQRRMSYAALASGITLAQTGLGSVHGLASPLGAFYPIPHGVVCGTLVGAATRINIEAMLAREPTNPALDKYARTAEILCNKAFATQETAWSALISLLDHWTQVLNLPKLSHYGAVGTGRDKIVANARGSSMKTNPIVLTDEEIHRVLDLRL